MDTNVNVVDAYLPEAWGPRNENVEQGEPIGLRMPADVEAACSSLRDGS